MRPKLIYQVLVAIFFLTACYFPSFSQDSTQKTEIKWGGFVNVDYMFDSRQTVAAREGHFLLFPSPIIRDANGEDINATPNFNILAIRSRLKASISGPDFFHFKTTGLIEAAFFGQTNADVNGLRLRHAWLKLSDDKVDILLGQYWHPMFITSCFPGTYSFNTGAPFQPFSRDPQLRISTKGNWKWTGVFYSQRDFASWGPKGTTSDYLRNSAIPAMHVQVAHVAKKLEIGVGADFKILKPALTDPQGNKSNKTIDAKAVLAWLKWESPFGLFKMEGVWGENMSDLLMLGGMAQSDSLGSFCNIRTISLWSELSGSTEHLEWGIFGGYSQNLGLENPLCGNIYGIGTDIHHLYRIAPRIGLKSGKTKVGIEMEYTAAKYGQMEQNTETIQSVSDGLVGNLRVLGHVMYKF